MALISFEGNVPVSDKCLRDAFKVIANFVYISVSEAAPVRSGSQVSLRAGSRSQSRAGSVLSVRQQQPVSRAGSSLSLKVPSRSVLSSDWSVISIADF